MAACIASMKINSREPYIEGLFMKINREKPENQAFVEFKYTLKKTNYRIRQNIRGGKLSRFSWILAKRESFTIESFPSSQLENFIIIP